VLVYVPRKVRLTKLQAAAQAQADGGAAPKAAHACRRWQHKVGVEGSGVPDKRSLTKLGRRYGFTVV
jgi:hypothetical protein